MGRSGKRWPEKLAMGRVSTAKKRLGIGCSIADLTILFTRTVTHAGQQQSFLCGTSVCPSYGIARYTKKCALRWRQIYCLARAAAPLEKGRPHDALTAINPYRQNLLPNISKIMRPALRKAGVGRETGPDSTASSSKVNGLRIISDRTGPF